MTACYHCKEGLPRTGPRVVIDGLWTCAACAYRLEIGRDLEVPPTRDQTERLEQDHLFPIESYTKPTPRDRGGS